jgi:hypothetical protein
MSASHIVPIKTMSLLDLKQMICALSYVCDPQLLITNADPGLLRSQYNKSKFDTIPLFKSGDYYGNFKEFLLKQLTPILIDDATIVLINQYSTVYSTTWKYVVIYLAEHKLQTIYVQIVEYGSYDWGNSYKIELLDVRTIETVETTFQTIETVETTFQTIETVETTFQTTLEIMIRKYPGLIKLMCNKYGYQPILNGLKNNI